MNNKMKKVNVEIEIPVDCNIEDMLVTNYSDAASYFITYKKMEPRTITLREVIGVERVPSGYYYMKEGSPVIYMNTNNMSYQKDSNETVYELVHANTK